MGGGKGEGSTARQNLTPKKSGPTSKSLVKQFLTNEFRLTKKMIREEAEAYLASEGTFKAAKKLLDLLDSKKEKIALEAAKQILDRVGVKDQKETLSDLIKTKLDDTVSTEFLERIVDSEPIEAQEEDSE
jgi:hypothetical protein